MFTLLAVKSTYITFFPFNKKKKNPLGLLCQSFKTGSNQNVTIYLTQYDSSFNFFSHTCMQVIHIHHYRSMYVNNESGNSFRPQSWSTLGSHTCGIRGHTKQILCLSLFPVGRGVFWAIVQSLAGLAAWSRTIFSAYILRVFVLWLIENSSERTIFQTLPWMPDLANSLAQDPGARFSKILLKTFSTRCFT